LVIAASAATGCSSSSHTARPPTTPPASSTPTSTSTTVPATAAQLRRRACAAYEAFWDVDYSGGEPSPAMLARERALVTAAEATTDRPLHDAMRGVIEGELGLPRFYLRATAAQLQQEANALPPDAKAALQEVLHNDALVRAKCADHGGPADGSG